MMDAKFPNTMMDRAVAEIQRTAATWLVVLLAAMIYLVPGAADLLQYDRRAMAGGEWWRYFTGYVTHWNPEHLFWDVLMFAVVGRIVERQSRWRMIALCAGSATAISGFTWFARSDVVLCRGLSGIDTALFTYLAVVILANAVAHRQWVRCLISGVLFAGFAAKLLFEVVTGSTLFVDSDRAGFVVLTEAHVLGALAGITAAWIAWREIPPQFLSATTPARDPRQATEETDQDGLFDDNRGLSELQLVTPFPPLP